jgi:hypothetical protein
MVSKPISFNTEQVALMSFPEIGQHLENDENDLLFALSPEILRASCEYSKNANHFLMQHIGARVGRKLDDDIEMFDRPGYLVPMSDRTFLRKILRVVTDCTVGPGFPDDVDEAGYAAYHSMRASQRAAARAGRNSNRPSAAVTLPLAPTLPPPTSIDEKDSKDEFEADHVYLVPQLFEGQLNLSNLITGSRVLAVGAGVRPRWTEREPLAVTSISGIPKGTTTVDFVGEQLRVPDVETLAAAIRFGAKEALGTDVPLSESALLKALRRADGGGAYSALRAEIVRLQHCKLIIRTVHGPLISAIANAMPEDKEAQKAVQTGTLKVVISLLGDSTSSASDNKPGTVGVNIPRRVRGLIGKGLSSWFDENDYYALKGPTARRLFLLYARHANAWGFTRDELKEFLGSTAKGNDDFKKMLDKAFKEMYEKGIIACVPKYAPEPRRHGIKAYAVTLLRNRAMQKSADSDVPPVEN